MSEVRAGALFADLVGVRRESMASAIEHDQKGFVTGALHPDKIQILHQQFLRGTAVLLGGWFPAAPPNQGFLSFHV